MSWLAITLFRLREDRTVADFRRHSLEFVRPEMMKMPTVLGFRDFAVAGTMDGFDSPWNMVEIIEISSPSEFERDNTGDQGSFVTRHWLPWVEDFAVLYCENLAIHGADPGLTSSGDSRIGGVAS